MTKTRCRNPPRQYHRQRATKIHDFLRWQCNVHDLGHYMKRKNFILLAIIITLQCEKSNADNPACSYYVSSDDMILTLKKHEPKDYS